MKITQMCCVYVFCWYKGEMTTLSHTYILSLSLSLSLRNRKSFYRDLPSRGKQRYVSMWVRVRMTWGVCVCIGVKSVMCVHETELEFHCCCCCCCYVHIYLLLFALFTWEWMAANEQESMYACVSEWMNMLLGCCSLYIRFTDLLELDCGRRNELAVPEIVCSLAGKQAKLHIVRVVLRVYWALNTCFTRIQY